MPGRPGHSRVERGYLLSGSDGQGSLMGRNGEPGAFGLAAARGGVELGVGARFARFGTGAGTSNVASEPLRDTPNLDYWPQSPIGVLRVCSRMRARVSPRARFSRTVGHSPELTGASEGG